MQKSLLSWTARYITTMEMVMSHSGLNAQKCFNAQCAYSMHIWASNIRHIWKMELSAKLLNWISSELNQERRVGHVTHDRDTGSVHMVVP